MGAKLFFWSDCHQCMATLPAQRRVLRRILHTFYCLAHWFACVQSQALLLEQISDEVQVRRMNLQVSRFTNKISGQVGSSKVEGSIRDSGITLKTLISSGKVLATYTAEAVGGGFEGQR
jgi:hypothetical protein